MAPDDEFMDIINHSNMGNLQSESELFNLSIGDMIRGLRALAECSMIISDFIDTYISEEDSEKGKDDDDDDEDGPEMPIEAVMYAKQLFEIADKFTYAILSEEYIDDDEELITYDDDDDEEYDDDDD